MYTNFDAHNVYNIDRINSNLQISMQVKFDSRYKFESI